jgi:acetyltransferase
MAVAESDLALRDGRTVHLRPVQPGDEAEILQAFWRLSEDARYLRFMRVVREPDRERLRSVIASFPEAGIGIVATTPAADGIDIVGSAIAVLDRDRAGCEFAVTVGPDFSGAGLATALMTSIIDEARRRGLEEMRGYVLAQNKPMLRLARGLGFDITIEAEDASVRLCRMLLRSS